MESKNNVSVNLQRMAIGPEGAQIHRSMRGCARSVMRRTGPQKQIRQHRLLIGNVDAP